MHIFLTAEQRDILDNDEDENVRHAMEARYWQYNNAVRGRNNPFNSFSPIEKFKEYGMTLADCLELKDPSIVARALPEIHYYKISISDEIKAKLGARPEAEIQRACRIWLK